MPCNLAVSIAKAAIAEERLRALLTPEAIGDVVLKYLKQHYAASSPSLLPARVTALRYRVGTMVLTIQDGQVTVAGSQGQRAAEQLATNITGLLGATADRLFQQQVQQALRPFTTQAQASTVSFEGRQQQAAVFHINLNR